MTKYEWLRQFISPFINGKNADAILQSLADEGQRQDELSIAVTDQLTICTASEEYLDKRLAEIGITRPAELGMDDLAFRKMGIQINAQKQIVDVLHTVLETFFGEDTVRAYSQSTLEEPYILEDGDDLIFELEDGIERTLIVRSSDFRNISAATAQEVSDVITRFCRSQNLNAYGQVLEDVESGKKYVRLFGGCKGPFSTVKVLGGKVQSILMFPTMRGTALALNDTSWQITRTVGSTLRFRWYSNSQPLLSKVVPGDRVMLYGPQFNHPIIGDLRGTFTVTNVRPPSVSPSLDSGWFEIENTSITSLSATPPDTAPPSNSPPTYYSFLINQAEYSDLEFFIPKKSVPYSTPRYALAFEPSNSILKIYVPATTRVVRRDLVGAAHLHMLYDQYNLNGSYGSSMSDSA